MTILGSGTWVLVTTCREYAVAADALGKQLEERSPEIPRDRIVFVVCDSPETRVDPEARSVQLQANIYEYSAFVAAHMGILSGWFGKDDTFLLLHDTVRFKESGSFFAERVNGHVARLRDESASIVWMFKGGQFNLCVFDAEAARCGHERFGEWKTLDKMKGIRMEHNQDDDSVKRFPVKQVYLPFDPKFKAMQQLHAGATHVRRRIMDVSQLGIEKGYVHVLRSNQHPQRP